jgi:hypothetical protein
MEAWIQAAIGASLTQRFHFSLSLINSWLRAFREGGGGIEGVQAMLRLGVA